MEAQHHALLAAHLLLEVGVGQEGEQSPIHPGGGLDHVRDHVLLPLLVEVGERLAARLRVLLEIEVGAVRDSHQLAPADRKAIVDVDGAFRVVGQLVPVVLTPPEVLVTQPVAPEPRQAVLDPAVVPVLVRRSPLDAVVGVDEVLDLHLLELARAEDEVARRDLVAEGPAGLGDAEGQLEPHGLQHVLEIYEHGLGRLGTKIGDRGVVFDGTHEGLEHEVELARRRELALAAIRA